MAVDVVAVVTFVQEQMPAIAAVATAILVIHVGMVGMRMIKREVLGNDGEFSGYDHDAIQRARQQLEFELDAIAPSTASSEVMQFSLPSGGTRSMEQTFAFADDFLDESELDDMQAELQLRASLSPAEAAQREKDFDFLGRRREYFDEGTVFEDREHTIIVNGVPRTAIYSAQDQAADFAQSMQDHEDEQALRSILSPSDLERRERDFDDYGRRRDGGD